MRNGSIRLSGSMVAALLVSAWLPLWAAGRYVPTIPPGYTSKVVLHVDYGTTPEKIRLFLGDEEGSDPAAVRQMRIAGDRFYFVDDVAGTIKQYRSPGVFVWETKRLRNVHYFDLAPDGSIYAVWGGLVDQLSLINGQGKVVWTKTFRGVEEKLNKLGVRPAIDGFSYLDSDGPGRPIPAPAFQTCSPAPRPRAAAGLAARTFSADSLSK